MPTKKNSRSTNKNAVIVSRQDRNGRLRTETQGRDPSTFQATITTATDSNSTNMFINVPTQGGYNILRFNGRQARTLYRLLQNHYEYTGKPVS